MTTPSLEPPHAFLAAAELLRDLQARPELAPYILPECWLKNDQHSAISNLSAASGVAVVVGVGDTRLPAAGQRQQGGLVRVSVVVYVFQPAEGTLGTAGNPAQRHSVWLSVIRALNSWTYTLPNGRTVKAYLDNVSDIDLSNINPHFAKKVMAEAIVAEIPLQLTLP